MKIQTQKIPLIPIMIGALVVILDQITKFLVVANIPENSKIEILGDFLWFVHIRNTGFVFGLGDTIPQPFKGLLSVALPIFVVIALVMAYLYLKDITRFQRDCLVIAVGGGLGNLLDRIFRPEGVVDFISFNFYGFFGLPRWYAFNIADAALVTMLVFLSVSLFFNTGQEEQRI